MPLEKSEERVGEEHNCANYGEGKLEAGSKELVGIESENEEGGARQTI